MKKQIYVLNQRQEETFDAAGKAMRDVFALLRKRNAKVLWGVPKNCNKLLKILDLPYLLLFILFSVKREDIIFYSIPENYIKIRLVNRLRKRKHYKTACFINDLNAFRYDISQMEEMDEASKTELKAVKAADIVLAPNKNTEKMLRKLGVDGKIIPVSVWDYLMNEKEKTKLREEQQKAETEPKSEIHIAFAGNLNKSEFLFHMKTPEHIQFDLWGKLEEEKKAKLPEGCIYHGMLSSEEVPMAVCAAHYGLVWDGDGADEISGGLGEYLRYNNSHKCALYLAAGLPVIVWKHSGMAHFVEEHGCGIKIDRLSDISKQLETADYQQLKAAAMKVSSGIQEGYYLNRAFDQMME